MKKPAQSLLVLWKPVLVLSVMFVLMLLSATAAAQSLTPRLTPEPHKFMDRTNKTAFAVEGSVRLLDTVMTCRKLSRPGVRELWYPAQSCAGIAAFEAGDVAASIGLSYWLHRRGSHKLERLVPYFYTAGPTIGLTITLTKR